jgi:hypothetical protein
MSKAIDLIIICESIYIPKGSLGISRKDMPQIKSTDVPEFIKYLATKDIKTDSTTVKAASLKPTQKEIQKERVADLATIAKDNLSKPLIISKDGYVLDGHHRWLALINKDKAAKIKVVKVNVTMKELLELAKKFPKVSYKQID